MKESTKLASAAALAFLTAYFHCCKPTPALDTALYLFGLVALTRAIWHEIKGT